MTKQQAILLAAAFAAYTPDATAFFVTTDEKVFTNAEDAVANAVKLSPGNPTVIDVSVNELAGVEVPVVETPVVEAPVAEVPVVETPVVEAPVAEAPVAEAPAEIHSAATTYGKTPAEIKAEKEAAKKAK